MSTMDGEKQTATAMPAVTFEEFPPTTYEEWKAATIVALKGGVFEKRMFTKTYEGIQLEPIYTSEDTKNLTHPHSLPGEDYFLRGVHAGGYVSTPWKIAQKCAEALPAKFNETAKQELAKGSTSLNIALDTATLEGVDATDADAEKIGDQGVSLSTLQDAAQAFADINLTQNDLHLYTGFSNVAMLALLTALAKSNGQAYKNMSGCIGADPIGALAGTGNLPASLGEMIDELTHATAWAAEKMPNMRTILVRGEVYHDGGANSIQEIGYAMSAAIAYIRELQQRGLDINIIAKHIRFSFSLGSNFFMEIAKIRAARMIWAQIVEAFGGDSDARKINIHARTSFFTKTTYDPYVNMLRTTTESFSGVVGGVDSMEVGCFDEPIRHGDEFARRIARNTQLLLQNECNLMQPVDPAGGSWYIETLTQQVAEKAWVLIQQLDEQGGIIKALEDGVIQKDIGAVLQQRFKNLANRSDRAVGTNMYPNMTEQPLEVPQHFPEVSKAVRSEAISDYRSDIDAQFCQNQVEQIVLAVDGQAGELINAAIKAFQAGATVGEIRRQLTDAGAAAATVEPIRVRRWTEQFEAMRDRTVAHKANTGETVQVFLANLGPIPQHKARADFSTGFMEVAAFEVLKNDGFPTVEEAAKAALESGADVAIICSTDDTYPEMVPPLARMIKEQNPKMKIILAGAPAKEFEASYREAGVDDFIHVKANCYQILSDLQDAKGMN
ncbi:methylmalonyl-CoA mutase [Sporomusaceae bacterium FL31]|nr:methylmalonyl-CoA mutase [Sporomusaceae bacterium FL31]GCE34060.1 methylmalonyl-CoA mutase [Sporomusaceae bacterium]